MTKTLLGFVPFLLTSISSFPIIGRPPFPFIFPLISLPCLFDRLQPETKTKSFDKDEQSLFEALGNKSFGPFLFFILLTRELFQLTLVNPSLSFVNIIFTFKKKEKVSEVNVQFLLFNQKRR